MNSKIALATALTLTALIGLIYAAINEINGYASRELLFGLILFGVPLFFIGITMLRDIVDQRV